MADDRAETFPEHIAIQWAHYRNRMEERLALEELTRLVEIYATSKGKPPFTEEELVVIALLVAEEPQTTREIFAWILERFEYFRTLSEEAFWARPTHTGMPSFFVQESPYVAKSNQQFWDSATFRERFDQVFWRRDVPLTVQEDDQKTTLYHVYRAEGLKFLQRHVSKGERGAFSFFRLPAEIRNVIYELVFQYPLSGLGGVYRTTTSYRPGRQFGVLSRTGDEEFDFEAWRVRIPKHWEDHRFPNKNGILLTKPVKEILAPLAVNRQLYNEAVPIFYGINRFHFTDTNIMASVLRSLAASRRKHIRHISFDFSKSHDSREAFGGLLELDGLVRLDIRVCGATFPNVKWIYEDQGFPVWRQLKGVQEVTFYGDDKTQEKESLDEFKDMMKASMMRPRDEPIESKKRDRDRQESKAMGSIPVLRKRRRWV